MSEYRQTLHDAVFRFPLRAAFALIPPRAQRLGHEVQAATRGDRASLDKRAQVKAWLARHFEIVDRIPTPSA